MIFLGAAVPVWIASQVLWGYDGGLNHWPQKNEVELLVVGLVASGTTAWCLLRRSPRSARLFALPIFLASAAFVLGGFKAANDYLDPPDLLLGILGQLVGFIYLVTVVPDRAANRGSGAPPPESHRP